jgi:uracil-DNA glycosylase family 4
MGKREAIVTITQQVEALEESPLYAYRVENNYHAVIGEGSLDAAIMFIGEAPGAQEAKTGRPFVGASGRVLDELLESIGLRREDVYITNVVKDRPPENRDPRADEVALYAPFLGRQIEIIQPRVIATLGRFAMDFILARYELPQQGEKISKLHGKPLEIEAGYGPLTFVPLYHPAVALYNRNQRGTLEEDFATLAACL